MDPITRKEMYLAKAAGQDVALPSPITREEMFLYKIATGGGSVGSGGGGADWNASEGEAGYVKNRTHYEGTTIIELLPETSYAFEDISGVIGVQFNGTIPLVAGNTYRVAWNGVGYNCVCLQGPNGMLYVGNASVVDGETDTGEPFVIGTIVAADMSLVVSNDGSTQAVVSITEVIETIHKLDKKFLPDDITSPPIEFILNEDETSVTCKLTAEELRTLSASQLHRNSVLIKGGGVVITPQSVAAGNGTSSFGTHTTITFVNTFCGASAAYPLSPVYVVIAENGDLAYVSGGST